MKVAIYARVSTTDQDCGIQLAGLKQYVQARNWELIEEFVDTGYSGRKASRPAMDKLMLLARKRGIDVICCTKMDRFGRSVLNLKNSIDELQRLGVRFIAVDQGIDTEVNSPISKLMINMLAAMAEFELELITERREEGIKRAKANGVHFGRPKAIFRRDLAVHMRQEGKSIRTIAKELGTNIAAIQRELASKGVSKPLPSLETFEQSIQAA